MGSFKLIQVELGEFLYINNFFNENFNSSHKFSRSVFIEVSE